jgi:hypothetical protein
MWQQIQIGRKIKGWCIGSEFTAECGVQGASFWLMIVTIQTPRNYPEESIQRLERDESLKSRMK